jgi:hypothetical protein
MKMMRKKRKKRRIGISLLLLLAAVTPRGANAGDKKTVAGPYAMVGGTVFQESGFALPNALVTLFSEPQAGGSAAKAKKTQAISDARGEFVFRVPAGAMRYTIRVAAKSFQTQEKSVTVAREERIDVTFQLQSESK